MLSSGPIEDLLVNVYRYGPEATIRLDFKANPQLYDDDTLHSHYDRFTRLLDGLLTADPDTPVGELPIVDEAELAAQLASWHVPGTPVEEVLPQLVARRAALTPERVAVVADGRRLTYGELASRANRLARHLIASGVGPEAAVGVVFDRSEELIVALLAVLTAGGGDVPVEAGTSAPRRDYVLADAEVSCVVTTRDFVAELDGREVPVIVVDDPATGAALASLSGAPVRGAERLRPLRSEHLAYTVYTSGSTGRPKGVQVSHRSAAALLVNAHAAFGTTARDVWTMFHSFAFDFSVWEIWVRSRPAEPSSWSIVGRPARPTRSPRCCGTNT
ncbi:AMP-binding protein [Prescottella defluvii]|nr:AMP-binding protein [Prescottella defluvii]